MKFNLFDSSTPVMQKLSAQYIITEIIMRIDISRSSSSLSLSLSRCIARTNHSVKTKAYIYTDDEIVRRFKCVCVL